VHNAREVHAGLKRNKDEIGLGLTVLGGAACIGATAGTLVTACLYLTAGSIGLPVVTGDAKGLSQELGLMAIGRLLRIPTEGCEQLAEVGRFLSESLTWRAVLLGGYSYVGVGLAVLGAIVVRAQHDSPGAPAAGALLAASGVLLFLRGFAIRVEIGERDVLVVNHFRSHRFLASETTISCRSLSLFAVPTGFARLEFADQTSIVAALATTWLPLSRRQSILSELRRTQGETVLSDEDAARFLDDEDSPLSRRRTEGE
jgi:hypothetical protein